MREITEKIYKFDELPGDIQEKVINKMADINVSDSFWYESVYDDAENIGLKITGFDIDRGAYCKGEFIESAEKTAHMIIDNHGDTCETYRTAETYLKDKDNLIYMAERDENGDFVNEYDLDGDLDDLDSEFLKSILEDYRIILSKEYDYLTSEEAIRETINANEYEFYEDGEMY